MRRSLIHYWRINLAVIFGAAVAAAVLTGALLVGDSVRGSLRDLTLDRLGAIDYVLLRQNFFRQDLATDLAAAPGFNEVFQEHASFILLNGNAVHAQSRARASQINIAGLDESLLAFYETANGGTDSAVVELSQGLQKESDQVFPSLVINQSLQNELNAEPGDQILLYFQKPSDIARGTLLGERDTDEVVESLRLSLAAIIPDRSIGRFGLRPHQTLPTNAYVSLPVLQQALEQDGRVNAVAVAQKAEVQTHDYSDTLSAQLADVLQFADLGLQLIEADRSFIIESEASVLSESLAAALERAAEHVDAPHFASYTYLANKMEHGDNAVPYSTVTALNTAIETPFKQLTLIDGSPAPALSGNEILLNNWAASDLQVRPGDTITMTYFGVGARDQLYTDATNFRVKGVVAMTGLAADPLLTPEYPGIADADNMADWDPPFEVDLGLIREKDEDYWDTYRGTPKAFVALEAGQELWGSRFGSVTSVRVAAAPGLDLAATKARFTQTLIENVNPAQFNYRFEPVKKQGLASSQGATDFSGLFVGFSIFLIVSAALLVGLLFRLGVEQRGKEIGTLLAVGFPQRKIRAQFLAEGGVLAAIGGLVGLAGAVFYAWLMMVGLRTWWLAAVGSPFLFLHVTVPSLATGYVISVVVILLSVWLGFRKLSKISPPALLAGVTTVEKGKGSARRARWVGIISLVLALVTTGYAFTLETSEATSVFFAVGAFVLISGLSFFSTWLRGRHKGMKPGYGLLTTMRMAARNSPRNPGRSMLSAALVGCACFVIVAVGANRVEFGKEVLRKDSGAGGFALVAQSEIPLHHDLSTEAGRFELGFSDDDSEMLSHAEIIPYRFRPGDDASCLNLYQVEQPRLLGVPESQIERGGFDFQQLMETETDGLANPWSLLNQEMGDNVIPVFGDYNSVLWILHSGLGQDIVMTDERGEEIKLRFVGLLRKSIFQSELLMSEANFLKHFPSQTGYAYFLLDTAADSIDIYAQTLEETLTDYGFDATTTAEKLQNFQAVENTYLSTFQTLGGLGLLLGTLGLGIILIRNVIERRGELATLRAFGFRRATLGWIVVAENGFLLLLGILVGTISAVLAVAPHIAGGASQVPWGSLLGTLLIVFLVGMLASVAAVSAAVRIPLLQALREE